MCVLTTVYAVGGQRSNRRAKVWPFGNAEERKKKQFKHANKSKGELAAVAAIRGATAIKYVFAFVATAKNAYTSCGLRFSAYTMI